MYEKGHTSPEQHIDTSVHDDGNVICCAFYYSWRGGIQDNVMERSLNDGYEMVYLSALEDYSKSIIRAYLGIEFSMWVPPHLRVTTTLPISFIPVISVTKLDCSNVSPF
jgi:hypothetical protein